MVDDFVNAINIEKKYLIPLDKLQIVLQTGIQCLKQIDHPFQGFFFKNISFSVLRTLGRYTLGSNKQIFWTIGVPKYSSWPCWKAELFKVMVF